MNSSENAIIVIDQKGSFMKTFKIVLLSIVFFVSAVVAGLSIALANELQKANELNKELVSEVQKLKEDNLKLKVDLQVAMLSNCTVSDAVKKKFDPIKESFDIAIEGSKSVLSNALENSTVVATKAYNGIKSWFQ